MTNVASKIAGAVLLAVLFLPSAALGQSQTIPNLALDAAPAGSDMLPIWPVGATRAQHATVAGIISSAFQSFTLALPAQFTCTPSPATATAGVVSITCSWNGSLTSHQFLGTSTGSTMGLFTLVATDLPIMVGSGASHAPGAVPDPGSSAGTTRYLREDGSFQVPPASTGTVTSIIAGAGLTGGTITTTGTIALALPSATTLGGIESKTCGASSWLNLINTSGVPSCTQPNFTDLLGSATCAQLPAFTGAITTSAGSCSTTLASSLTITTPTINTPVINSPTIGTVGTAGSSHLNTAGTTPTFSGGCTGGGTSPPAGSIAGDDAFLTITLSTGTGSPGTTGTCTVTWNGSYATAPHCSATLNDSVTSWAAAATVHVIPATSNIQVGWFTNSGALTTSASYKIDVTCGKGN